MPEVTLTPVRINDSSRLKEHIFPEMKPGDIAAFIRSSISDPSVRLYMATSSDASDNQVCGLVGLYGIQQIHNNAWVYCRFSDILGDLTDHVKEIKRKMIDTVLRIAFFSMHLHKVSWNIAISDFVSGDTAEVCGMRQEAILEEALCVDNVYVDAGMFSLLASEYPDYSVAFVCFPKGFIAVRGSSEFVEGVRFYSFGEVIEDPFDRTVAIRTGVADTSGAIRTVADNDYRDTKPALPSEVAKAAREISEYLKKARTKFSVNVRFSHGSDFQRHVWEEIRKIPYGVTVSYEDIAMALTGNDRVAARNLTRAVGSACSDNPIPVVIPCHRVIGKDGKLVGFSSGVEIKEFLIEHEIFGYFGKKIPERRCHEDK
ncbi:MAG: methylated-DNA--[protein]-cysteine S-methyltransferase [Clostridiaceae bacterium]|nr:methylated-DNA--[protein]-cysteine S-methyltransferase [Clostridiaceae bacterium]